PAGGPGGPKPSPSRLPAGRAARETDHHLIRSAAPAGGWVAGLSMYDWPEVRDEVDALWSAIARRLGEAGVDAPTCHS
ncbi:MAG TPA: hypothetical protein QGF43_07230, partial [Acidimicrobiales bacterium]|nr:hypothetical protein [Acidimicrobiales bacterium]